MEIITNEINAAPLDPLTRPIAECLVVDRTVAEWQAQALKESGFNQCPEGLHLEWDRHLFFTSGFLKEFITQAQSKGLPACAVVARGKLHTAFGPNVTGLGSVLDEAEDPDTLSYPMVLSSGEDVHKKAQAVAIPLTDRVSLRPQPGRMEEPILMPIEPNFAWRIAHWSDLLTVNLLMLQLIVEDLTTNVQGNECQIHPTASVSDSQLGSNARIGPFAMVHQSVVGDNVEIQEYGSIVRSAVGPGSTVQSYAQVRESTVGVNSVISFQSAIRNAVILNNSTISTPVVVRSVIGSNVFLSRGVSISATNLHNQPIRVWMGNKPVNTGMIMLGCAVGDGARIGNGIQLPAGYEVPAGYFLASRPISRLASNHPKGIPLIACDSVFRNMSLTR